MAERLTNDNRAERGAEQLDQARLEHQERLRNTRERESREADMERRSVEQASAEAKEAAAAHEKEQKQVEPELSPAEKRKAKTSDRTKITTEQSFKRVMKDTQSELSAPSRNFSKFIHIKPIEKVSEVAGNTIARPNAILFGSLSAFIIVAVLVIWAKNAGYALSGFETIAAFIIGYLIGVIIDFVRIAVTGKGNIE